MNKYTELSDFEINKKVANLVLNGDYIASEGKQQIYLATMDGGDFLPIAYFDPCNNPTDAMPIIIENKLTLSPRYDSDEWISESLFYHDIYSENKNPLRAAMEVFLMMKDKEINND